MSFKINPTLEIPHRVEKNSFQILHANLKKCFETILYIKS